MDLKLLILPVAIIFGLINVGTNDAFEVAAPFIIVGLSALFGMRIYKEWKAPAADVSNGVLNIYEQGTSQSIEKDKIESLEYIEKSSSLHEIHVKLIGYQPWVIELRDKSQHLSGNRLYHFINENFWLVIPNQQLSTDSGADAPPPAS